MKYAMLIYETPEAFAGRTNEDPNDPILATWRVYHRALLEAGIFVGGEPLMAPETGTTIRVKHGKREIQDGPHAGTKEELGGFCILELPSLDAAIEWAARCPAAALGAVEVRPLALDAKERIVG